MAYGAGVRRILVASLVALAACGGKEEGAPPKFGWADLQGTWDRVGILTNDGAGWTSQVLDVDAYGNATWASCENAQGGCTPTGTLRYEIDADGFVTATGDAGNPTLLGRMTAAKDLIVATATSPGSGTPQAYALHVFRKRDPAAGWSSADAASREFAYHALHTGAQVLWERGSGTTDLDGKVTIAAAEASSGALTPPAAGSETILVDGNGRVTHAVDATYRGIMTADKQVIFGVRTVGGGEFVFSVWVATGETFAQAELAGSWGYDTLVSAAAVGGSNWGRGTLTVDAAGNLSFQRMENAHGAPSNAGFTVQLAADGALTRTDYATYRAQVDAGRRLWVRTQTQSEAAVPPGPPSLSITAR